MLELRTRKQKLLAYGLLTLVRTLINLQYVPLPHLQKISGLQMKRQHIQGKSSLPPLPMSNSLSASDVASSLKALCLHSIRRITLCLFLVPNRLCTYTFHDQVFAYLLIKLLKIRSMSGYLGVFTVQSTLSQTELMFSQLNLKEL